MSMFEEKRDARRERRINDRGASSHGVERRAGERRQMQLGEITLDEWEDGQAHFRRLLAARKAAEDAA